MGPLAPLPWRELDDAEFQAAWTKYSSLPAAETPSRTWRIPEGFDLRAGDVPRRMTEFHQILLRGFQSLPPIGRKILALDYHHPSFELDPFLVRDAAEPWPVSVLPEGDDTIYVSADGAFGTCSTWNPETLTVFGAALLAYLERERPRLLELFS